MAALPFLAVGRMKPDMVMLASYCEMDEKAQKQTEDVFRRLLEASSRKLAPGQRQRLEWNKGTVNCLVDQGGDLLYCVVTSSVEYPERYAYQLLAEFQDLVKQVGGAQLQTGTEKCLNDRLHIRMQDFLRLYEDPKQFDKVNEALDKVSMVKSAMQDNVRRAVERGERFEDLQAKSSRMSASATRFQDQSAILYRRVWYKNMRFWACIGMLVVVVILIGYLMSPSGGGDDATKKGEKEDDGGEDQNTVMSFFSGHLGRLRGTEQPSSNGAAGVPRGAAEQHAQGVSHVAAEAAVVAVETA